MAEHSTAESPAVAAVVVTFNSAATIVDCVSSILASDAVREVVVIDNQSRDDTVARVRALNDRRLRVMVMSDNLGFARAANEGAISTASPLIAFINPDACNHTGTIETLRDALVSREFWAAGPALLNQHGYRERSARAFPTEANALFNWRYLRLFPRTRWKYVHDFLMLSHNLDQNFECDWVSGAFFIAWRDVFEKIGRFDGSYALYYEDIDLFRRANNHGYRACFVGAATAVHLIGQSARTVPFYASLSRVFSFIRYYRRHLRKGIISDLRAATFVIAGISLVALAPFRQRT